MLTQAGNQEEEVGYGQEDDRNFREVPALALDAPDHDQKASHEGEQSQLLPPGEVALVSL